MTNVVQLNKNLTNSWHKNDKPFNVYLVSLSRVWCSPDCIGLNTHFIDATPENMSVGDTRSYFAIVGTLYPTGAILQPFQPSRFMRFETVKIISDSEQGSKRHHFK